MTIHDMARFTASLPDWSVLDGCFGGAIKPTDIDGCVERRGQILFLEHKGEGAEVKTGQRILFEALARSGHAVIAYWTDDPDKQHVLRLRKWWGATSEDVNPASLDDLRATCASWYQQADARQLGKKAA